MRITKREPSRLSLSVSRSSCGWLGGEEPRVYNLEAMFARYNRLEADNEGYFQDYDLSSYESVETVSRRKTIVVNPPVNGEQLALL